MKNIMIIVILVSMLMPVFARDVEPVSNVELIGYSTEGRPIDAVHYGNKNSDTALILIGGIHGLYESNNVDLMREFKEYFASVDLDISLYIIENINPDSFYTDADLDYQYYDADGYDNDGDKIGVVWSRFNSNGVDLNRNWDTASWKPDVTYTMLREGAGGSAPMSEVETRVVADFLLHKSTQYENLLVINYHSFTHSRTETGMAQPSYTGDWQNPEINAFANEFALIYSENNDRAQYLRAWTRYEVPGEFLNWAGNNNISAIDIEVANNDSIFEVQSWGKTHYEQHLAAVIAVVEALN
jgi:hypothetical protein